jgi:hypothetical protein
MIFQPAATRQIWGFYALRMQRTGHGEQVSVTPDTARNVEDFNRVRRVISVDEGANPFEDACRPLSFDGHLALPGSRGER